MKAIKEIHVMVKKVTYMEVIISEERGYDMPEDVMSSVDLVNSVRDDISSHIQDVDYAEGRSEFEIEDISIVEEED